MTDKQQIIDQAIKFSEEYSKGYEAGLSRAIEICNECVREYNFVGEAIYNKLLKEIEE